MMCGVRITIPSGFSPEISYEQRSGDDTGDVCTDRAMQRVIHKESGIRIAEGDTELDCTPEFKLSTAVQASGE